MDAKTVKAILGLVCLALPFVLPLFAYFLPRNFVIEATMRQYQWQVGASILFGALWVGVLTALVPKVVLSLDSAKHIFGLIVLAYLTGYVGGGLLLQHLNRWYSADAGSVVRVKTRHFGHTTTEFEIVDGPHAGLPFSCGWTTWKRLGAQPSMILRSGRFGLWWGELLFEDERASRR